jgi:predicted Fe-S protein YdhL (DUF1289 family)
MKTEIAKLETLHSKLKFAYNCTQCDNHRSEVEEWKKRYDDQRKDFKEMMQHLQKSYQSGKQENIRESTEKVSQYLRDNLPYWE